MVAPVTGPFTRTIKYYSLHTVFNTLTYQRDQTWYKQRKPYSIPLAYSMSVRNVDSVHFVDNRDLRDISNCPSYNGGYTVNPGNKAYGKLVSALGEASLWAVNIAEHKQAYGMIAARATTLWRFAKAINRFDIPLAARILGVSVPPRLRHFDPRRTAKSVGNLWLEFHFGWEPLVQDIGAGISTLTKPIQPKKLVGKGKGTTFEKWGVPGQNAFTATYDSKVRMECKATVTNPNLFIASQLGFVNPLAIAWELVPFSFVVDWFVNVGQVLGSMTDFAGVTLVDKATTTYQVIKKTEQWYTGVSASYTTVTVSRSQSITGPSLRVRPWNGVSPVRAITAISLLVQQLGR